MPTAAPREQLRDLAVARAVARGRAARDVKRRHRARIAQRRCRVVIERFVVDGRVADLGCRDRRGRRRGRDGRERREDDAAALVEELEQQVRWLYAADSQALGYAN